jgi:uncharacterized protein YcnI
VKKVAALALVLVVVFLGATPARAHVTVSPSEVAEGEFTVLTFQVPNESDTASTVAIEVVFPEAAPFRFVSVKPVPGWVHSIVANGDTVTGITWEGSEIAPGEFQQFEVSIGPIPDVDVLEFKAVQTYDDGEVVRWIDPTVEGEDEPEHPAPRASVLPAGGEGDAHGNGGGGTAAADPDDDGVDGTDTATFIALVVAGASMVTAVAAVVMARNRVPT